MHLRYHLDFDLESQGHILFPMVDYVVSHVKTKAGMFLSWYIEPQIPKIKTSTKFYKSLKRDNNYIPS